MTKFLFSLNYYLLAILLAPVVCDAQTSKEYRQENLSLQLSITSNQDNDSPIEAGLNNRVRLGITDVLTRQPLSGLKPKAWLSLRRSEQVAAETSCEAKVRSFASGQLTTRADVDLNSYLLLTLNQDKTVAFINPQVAWSRSKLESIVVLPEQGLDWVMTKDGKWLYVTLPDASAVAMIDTSKHKVVSVISTGKDTKPTRIALSPDQQSLWVGLDGSAKLAVLARGEKPELQLLEAAPGLHQISFTQDGKLAMVTNTAANSVSVFEVATRNKLGDVTVENTPLKALWVEKAGLFYVTSLNDKQLNVVDPFKLAVVNKIEVGQGAVDLAVDPQGRFVWVVNQLASQVLVLDSATNIKLASAAVPAEPDQITFTAGYAYVRSLASEKFALIEIGQVAKLATNAKATTPEKMPVLAVTQIQAGEQPPATATQAIGVAPMIVPIPEQNGAMIASAPGKTIYYYTEGMMVPMGTVDNYQRIPRALMIVDRSLHETSPGVFEAPVTVEKTGNYDVAVLLDQPRIIHCFTAKFEGMANGAEQPALAKLKLVMLPLNRPPIANSETVLNFKLLDVDSGKSVSGIQDARLLAFEPPGLWQKREWLQEISNGVYQATLFFPHAGNFNLLVEAKSSGLEFTKQTLQLVKVQDFLPKSQNTLQK